MQVQGPPLPGVTLRIVDPDSARELPQGEVGLIEVKGYLTPGYDGASASRTPRRSPPTASSAPATSGGSTAEGDLQFAARDSEMIKRAGINIAPAEIEEILQQHPGRRAAVGVAGAPHPTKGEVIVAFVVPAPGAAVSGEELRKHCRALAASYKMPDRIEICATLPVTTTGKLLRRELKQMAAASVEGDGRS